MRAMRAEGFKGYPDLEAGRHSQAARFGGTCTGKRSLPPESRLSSTLFCPEDIHERRRLWSSGQRELVWWKTRTAPIFHSARA